MFKIIQRWMILSEFRSDVPRGLWTFPSRFKIPKTIVLPDAPRPRLPRTLLAPKWDSSTSISPDKGDAASQMRAKRIRIL